MFPRIQKQASTASTSTSKRNDSSAVRNLIFGGVVETEAPVKPVVRNLEDLESKIDSKLKEIDQMFTWTA